MNPNFASIEKSISGKNRQLAVAAVAAVKPNTPLLHSDSYGNSITPLLHHCITSAHQPREERYEVWDW